MSTFHRASSIITELFDGEAVLVDLAASELHRLNGTATAVWLACDGSASVEQIAARVAAQFGEAPGTRDQVAAFVADLEARGLLVSATS